VAMIKEGRSYSILTDQLGTPTEAYDAEGNEVWSRVLDMDGNVIEETGNKGMVPFLFQGQYYDRETGLAYNRFRYYSPKMGMYVSQDPIRLAGGILNLYGYVSDTNAWIDVLGLLRRPYIRKSTRQRIEGQGRILNGVFLDANTSKPISGEKRRSYSIARGEYDLGHKKGHEHWRLIKIAEKRGYTQKQFNNWVNKHPNWFQIEDPMENQSHRHEKKRKKTSYQQK
ncbi:RHS repeat-associated core domain-containing protein, partial [Phocaeicola vulgatus]